ncbi:MAG: DUF433 domain-containing protein [Verrucomicrobiota bacterium]
MTAVETNTHIVRDEKGIAWLAKKNIKVIEVVMDHLAYGWSADAIHEQHPHLSLAEIHSALAFYYDHTAEFDAQIAKQKEELKALRAATGESSLQKRLHTAR